MNDKLILIFSVLSFFLRPVAAATPTVEYVCWQQGNIPGFAFESSQANCGPGDVRENGSVSELLAGEKRIVCLLPAACVALSPKVRELLQEKIGVNSVKGLSKFSSGEILQALHKSEFTGRFSYLTCAGYGKISEDSNQITKGKISLSDAKCPSVTDCANSDQVFYNMQGVSPETLESAGTNLPEIRQVPEGITK